VGLGAVTVADMSWTAWCGLVPWLYVPEPAGLARPVGAWLWAPPDAGPALFATAWLAYVAITLGFFVRPAILVALLVHAQLGALMPIAEQGVDHIVRTAMLMMLFAPCDRRWAIGPSRRQDTIAAGHTDLLRWLIVLVYLGSGVAKPLSDWGAWMSLQGLPATLKIMADPLSGAIDPELAWSARPLFKVLDVATLIFELGAPLLLTRWARGWAALGVIMHLGLFATMHLGQFPWAMLAFYPLWYGAPALRWLDTRAPPTTARPNPAGDHP
jgi:hypothetical protein